MTLRLAARSLVAIAALVLVSQMAAVSRAGPPIQTCVDPSPDGGGELQFEGVGTPVHVASSNGHVCPGQSETWTFSTFDVPFEQVVRTDVTALSGSVTAIVRPQSGDDVPLEQGIPFRSSRMGAYTFQVIVTGAGDGLATYEVHACRTLPDYDPCPLRPLPGDVDCNNRVNSVDAMLILQFTARLLPTLACSNVADVRADQRIDAVDAELVLQIEAGLIADSDLP